MFKFPFKKEEEPKARPTKKKRRKVLRSYHVLVTFDFQVQGFTVKDAEVKARDFLNKFKENKNYRSIADFFKVNYDIKSRQVI